MRLLITGSNGFVGRHLCSELLKRGYALNQATREATTETSSANNRHVSVGAINKNTEWKDALHDCQAVIHLAARVHVMNETSADPLADFREVNVDGTLALAQQAAQAGIKRFIFTSTIGVNGQETTLEPFTPDSIVAPHSAYALSKYEAELGLHEIGEKTGMEMVIIRPPLVYGPNAPGNFGTLLKIIQHRIPLPLGSVTKNRRSYVSVFNLVDLLITCVRHPLAGNQIFMVSDNDDLSTAELLRKLAKAANSPVYLLPFPSSFLELGAKMLGKKNLSTRLLKSLQADITKTRELLNWEPYFSVDEGLEKTLFSGN